MGRDSNLQVQDVTHTRGPRLHFDYDATGLTLTAVTSSDGRTVSYASTSGRLVSVSKPGGLTWQYGYDDEGRLFEIRDPSGRVIYEADLFAGQVAAQRDGRGNGQGISYLPAITLTDLASGSTTRIDEFGRSLTDTYDSRGFATSAINQEGATTLSDTTPLGTGLRQPTQLGPRGGLASRREVTQGDHQSYWRGHSGRLPARSPTQFDHRSHRAHC